MQYIRCDSVVEHTVSAGVNSPGLQVLVVYRRASVPTKSSHPDELPEGERALFVEYLQAAHCTDKLLTHYIQRALVCRAQKVLVLLRAHKALVSLRADVPQAVLAAESPTQDSAAK